MISTYKVANAAKIAESIVSRLIFEEFCLSPFSGCAADLRQLKEKNQETYLQQIRPNIAYLCCEEPIT